MCQGGATDDGDDGCKACEECGQCHEVGLTEEQLDGLLREHGPRGMLLALSEFIKGRLRTMLGPPIREVMISWKTDHVAEVDESCLNSELFFVAYVEDGAVRIQVSGVDWKEITDQLRLETPETFDALETAAFVDLDLETRRTISNRITETTNPGNCPTEERQKLEDRGYKIKLLLGQDPQPLREQARILLDQSFAKLGLVGTDVANAITLLNTLGDIRVFLQVAVSDSRPATTEERNKYFDAVVFGAINHNRSIAPEVARALDLPVDQTGKYLRTNAERAAAGLNEVVESVSSDVDERWANER